MSQEENTTTTVWAVVPAGGSGERFSKSLADGPSPEPVSDKLLANIDRVPVLIRTVESLMKSSEIDGVMLVAPADKRKRYHGLLDEFGHKKRLLSTDGGATRRESVYNGLTHLPEEVDIVVVHDAARPLIDPAIVSKAVAQLKQGVCDGTVVGLPLYDTIKRVDTNPAVGSVSIRHTEDRQTLWRAQTPQVFNKKALREAHEKVSPTHPLTDDAQLMELAGYTCIQMIEGNEKNLKITTHKDIALAEALMRQ